jgi:hypothetical protein
MATIRLQPKGKTSAAPVSYKNTRSGYGKKVDLEYLVAKLAAAHPDWDKELIRTTLTYLLDLLHKSCLSV